MYQGHGNKEQTDCDQRERGQGITRKRRGRVKSRNMYIKDPWTRTGRGGLNVREGLGRARESNGGKMGTTVTEQQ